MYRVLSCLRDQHDYRLVLLAVLICALATYTAGPCLVSAKAWTYLCWPRVWRLISNLSSSTPAECQEVQGYYFGRPTSAHQIRTALASGFAQAQALTELGAEESSPRA